MYYGLSNYYQNHRRYVKSRDDDQLLGHLSLTPSTDCVPFAYADTETGVQKPIAPCGAIANSLFNGNLLNDPQLKFFNTLTFKTLIFRHFNIKFWQYFSTPIKYRHCMAF